MKAKSRIPSPGTARTSTDKPSIQWQGLPGSPASTNSTRLRPESINPSSSILDWQASSNKAFPPSRQSTGSVAHNDAASAQDDLSANIDADGPSPVGSVAKGMASMGLGPERPPTPPAPEPKSSKMRSNILVAVRMRPLSEKERGRGDHEIWMLDEQNNIGLYGKDGSFVPKHRYDTVFGKQATNLDVHAVVARPLVAPALQGISGTVFAYGVTSSGKTHTMMGGYSEGHGAEPGIVPNVVRELFAEIEKVQAQQQQASGSPYYKQFSVRLSMMEIYNEVINDLLQPGQVNLKLLEVGGKGLV
ncbi:P-loop containing nucleoside triphosphate hydrolase protein, partial [Dunaliella salina]